MAEVLEILWIAIISRVIIIVISVALMIAIYSLVKFMIEKAKGK